MSQKYTIRIKQGKTYQNRIEYWYNGSLYDLTEYEARMQIRPSFTSTTVYCNLTTQIGADGSGLNLTPISASVVLPKSSGSIGITISAYSSSQFTWKEAFYDLEIYSGSGVSEFVREIISGKVLVQPEITKTT